MVILPNGHFAYWSFRLQDTSRTGQFAQCMVILPNGHFAYWSFRLQDTSPTGQFACYLGILPTRPNLNFGEVVVSLRLLFEVWQVISVCLTSNSSTVCMEYLLIFHIIMEHVQSWLKLDVLLQTVHIIVRNYIRARYINANGHHFIL